MTLLDKIHDAFPALPLTEVYDDHFPAEVAGHVEAAPFHDDTDIHTPHGIDVGFDGDSLPSRDGKSSGQEVGTQATNRRIDETVEESKHRQKREPVTDAAQDVVYGNETLPDTTPRRILIRNKNRKAVVVTNQGASLVAIGKGGNIAINAGVPSPNAIYLPAGSARTLTHTQEVWIVGAANGVVDWTEENYT